MIIYRTVQGRVPAVHITAGAEAVGMSVLVRGETEVRALMEECKKALEAAKAATDSGQ